MGREGLTLKALLQRRWNFILLSFLTVNNATYLYRIFVINFERLIHYYDTSIATRATISPVFFFFHSCNQYGEKTTKYIGTNIYFSKCGVISGPYFPVFGPNTGKYEPEITLYLDTFHAVFL